MRADLLERPPPTSPLRTGRVRDGDLLQIKGKVKAALKAAREAGVDETKAPVTDEDKEDIKTIKKLTQFAEEFKVHVEERERLLREVDDCLAAASRFPFSASAFAHVTPDSDDNSVPDPDLVKFREYISRVLKDARLAGVVEESLGALQDTYDDMMVFIAGRAEARAETHRIVSMLLTLYDAHPKLKDADQMEEFLDRALSKQALVADDDEEQDLITIEELVTATLTDCELVSLPAEEQDQFELRKALKELRCYITARSQCRIEIRALAEMDPTQLSRGAVAAAIVRNSWHGLKTER